MILRGAHLIPYNSTEAQDFGKPLRCDHSFKFEVIQVKV